MPSLGLLYLAAVTPREHTVRYFEAEANGSEPPEIYDADLVAISTFSAQVFDASAPAASWWPSAVCMPPPSLKKPPNTPTSSSPVKPKTPGPPSPPPHKITRHPKSSAPAGAMHEMEEFFPGRTPLENLELHANRKAHWNPRYADAIRRIQSHRITVNGCFILGLDGQDATVFPNILDFSITHGLYDVQITLLAPFPGTPLYDRLVRQSRILAPGRWDLCTLFDVNFLPSPLTLDELKNGLYWLGKNLYSAATTRLGRQGFHDQWRRAAVPAAAS